MDKAKEKVKDFLLELFFPSFCLACQKEGVLLCDDCKSTLGISEYNYCLCNKNSIRLPPQNSDSKAIASPRKNRDKNGKCSRCQDKKLSGLYFALPYQEKFLTKKLIHQFKYAPYLKTLAKDLASIVIEHLVLAKNNTEELWKNSILTPVPMDIKKMKNRGYNQSAELAQELLKTLKIPLMLDNLIKTKTTLPQMELSAKDRQENLKNAFLIKNPLEIKNKKIFLVDDVYTTGSTMEECAKVLRNAGAKQVWGIAIAREG